MRMFLPIKGPGGRALTPREKVALIVLGVTLVLCVLTLLAGERAWQDEPARNPIFAVVEFLCRVVGGGIVALYGIVVVWSALIYFKGERIADVTPIGGRLAALAAVTVGISGILGISRLETAGNLGLVVGGALGNTLGPFWSFPVLLLLLLLGLHLAGQGAWHAFREPMPVVAGGQKPSVGLQPGLGGITLKSPPPARVAEGPALPDDGDPSPDERSFAVTQAMEEIERSQGVTIVDVDPGTRASIGEEVAEAPRPHAETEEAEVRRGVDGILESVHDAAGEDEWEDEEDYEEEPSAEDDEEEAEEEEDYEVEAIVDDEEEEEEEEEPEEEEEVDEVEPEYEEEEEEEYETGDPYARGGLLRRIERPNPPAASADRPFTNFDWRGRPID